MTAKLDPHQIAAGISKVGFAMRVESSADGAAVLRGECPVCRAQSAVRLHLVPGLPVVAECACDRPAIRAAYVAVIKRGELYPSTAIVVNARPFEHVTADALRSLAIGNEPPAIFVRGAALTRVRRDESDSPFIERLSGDALRNDAARAAHYARMGAKGPSHVPPPLDVIRAVLALDVWPFPVLEAVIEAPALRPDGSVLETPGYDKQTRLLYQPATDLAIPAVPKAPSERQLSVAVEMINKIIAEFPFAAPADRANAVATMLTPVVRPAINGMVPLALFDGTRAGTGKNLLANTIALIATGRSIGVINVPQTEEEWRKLLTSTLDAGHTIVVLDEAHELRSTALASVLTTGEIADRRLGATEMIRARNRATWIACGNNIRLAGDMPRRCYQIRLNARTARPWKRTFAIPDLDAHVKANRGTLLGALLTIARAWWAADCPPAAVPVLGGFSEWSATIGGILAHAGIGDFLGNVDDLHETADVEATQWEHWLRTIRQRFDDTPFTAAELLSHTTARGPLFDALPDALADKVARHALTKATIGRALGAKADTYHGNDGIRITRASVSGRSGVATWTIVDSRDDHRPAPVAQLPQSSRARRAPDSPSRGTRGDTPFVGPGESSSASSAALQPEEDAA